MLRSLQLLRHEGPLEFRRSRGITVAGTPERGVGVMKARELVELGRKYGYRLDELVEIIEDLACPTSCRSKGHSRTLGQTRLSPPGCTVVVERER